MSDSIHKSTYGSAGSALLTDRDGYTHITSQGWLSSCDAPDAEDYVGEDGLDEWAEEQAKESIVRLAEANRHIADWRDV